jgi:hypothetical protein
MKLGKSKPFYIVLKAKLADFMTIVKKSEL